MIKKVKEIFQDILFKIYSKIPFLEWFLCSLCDLEMNIKFFLYGTEYRDNLHKEGIKVKQPNETWEEFQSRECYSQIPKNDLYCSGCPYWDNSRIASALFGQQSYGYCHYIGKGDFSYTKPTMLLWDMCKECRMYEDVEIEDEKE